MSTGEELQEQGIDRYKQQDYEDASRLFQQAFEVYKAAGDEGKAAEMQTNIGLTHRALGEHQQALDIMQLAMRTFEEQDDKKLTAQVLGNIGGVYYELDDNEQAYNCYRQAADLFLEIGEEQLYGETLVALARLQFRDRKFTIGSATYEAGLSYLGNLTMKQKIIKRLIGLRKGLIGG